MRAMFAAWLLLFAATPPVVAQNTSNADAEIRRILALETAWNRAEEHKDVKALDALLAPTLVYIDYDGTLMDKAQFLASAKAPSLYPEQIANESMAAQSYGDTVIVIGVYREKGKVGGRPYLRRGRFIDTWINQSGTWRCVSSQSTLISR
jgi:ketosteroid isomerase-like protein